MIFLDFARVNSSISPTTHTDDMPERTCTQFIDKLVLILYFILNLFHIFRYLLLLASHIKLNCPPNYTNSIRLDESLQLFLSYPKSTLI